MRFIEALFEDFGIPDRDQLDEMISVGQLAYDGVRFTGITGEGQETGDGGCWSEEDADDLDALDAPLWKTVALIHEVKDLVARELAKADNPSIRYTEDDLHALAEQLAVVGRAAKTIPRVRRQKGHRRVSRGNSEKSIEFNLEPLRAMMDVIAGYWILTLRRPFKQDHSQWEINDAGFPVPKNKAGKAVLFAYRVIEHIAPGQGGCLKTIAREYSGKSRRQMIVVGHPDDTYGKQ